MKKEALRAAMKGMAGDAPTGQDKGEYVKDSKPAKGKKLAVREIHIRKGHESGYIAKHIMEDESGMEHHQRPEYPISSRHKLKKHLDTHLPKHADESEADEAAE